MTTVIQTIFSNKTFRCFNYLKNIFQFYKHLTECCYPSELFSNLIIVKLITLLFLLLIKKGECF